MSKKFTLTFAGFPPDVSERLTDSGRKWVSDIREYIKVSFKEYFDREIFPLSENYMLDVYINFYTPDITELKNSDERIEILSLLLVKAGIITKQEQFQHAFVYTTPYNMKISVVTLKATHKSCYKKPNVLSKGKWLCVK